MFMSNQGLKAYRDKNSREQVKEWVDNMTLIKQTCIPLLKYQKYIWNIKPERNLKQLLPEIHQHPEFPPVEHNWRRNETQSEKIKAPVTLVPTLPSLTSWHLSEEEQKVASDKQVVVKYFLNCELQKHQVISFYVCNVLSRKYEKFKKLYPLFGEETEYWYSGSQWEFVSSSRMKR